MKLVSKYNEQRFEIIEDNPQVGFYLYIYDNQNICVKDYLQNSESMAKEFAFEEFGVPIHSWTYDLL